MNLRLGGGEGVGLKTRVLKALQTDIKLLHCSDISLMCVAGIGTYVHSSY